MSDEFGLEARVGAHRSQRARRMPWWQLLLLWAGAVVVLAVAGLLALQTLGGDFGPRDDSQTITPVTDPAEAPEGTSVGVLNATGDDGATAGIVGLLEDDGWQVGIVASAEERMERTVVFYRGAEFRETALGIAQLIGVDAVVASDADLSGSPITISVGGD